MGLKGLSIRAQKNPDKPDIEVVANPLQSGGETHVHQDGGKTQRSGTHSSQVSSSNSEISCAANKETLLGKGSFGAVYRGYHTQTSIQVAVKVYHGGDGEDIERELKSYNSLAKLQLEPNPFLKMFFCCVNRWSQRVDLGVCC